MKKSKIEWLDGGYTWNPVTGCLYDCPYCYGKRMAKRFFSPFFDGDTRSLRLDMYDPDGDGETMRSIWTLESRQGTPFLTGYSPTFHIYRLGELAHLKTPRNIFVCSMADLFGDWVPDSWIKEVLQACVNSPQHRYLFLTKNPDRIYPHDEDGPSRWIPEVTDYELDYQLWFGASTCTNQMMELAYENLNISWVSIEPIHEEISEDWFSCMPRIPGVREEKRFKWVVIGAETGNRKNKVIPDRAWIESIVEACKYWGTPVFMKNSLADIWGEPLIKQYPWTSEHKGESK